MPHAARTYDRKTLHRQGLRSVFAGWPPPFFDSWDLVPEASVVTIRGLELFGSYLADKSSRATSPWTSGLSVMQWRGYVVYISSLIDL